MAMMVATRMENTTVTAEEFTDPVMFLGEGYEYNIQYRWLDVHTWNGYDTEWHYNCTNKFSAENWYPSLKSVKNALAQMTATRYGYQQSHDREFRVVRRPVGEVEVVSG